MNTDNLMKGFFMGLAAGAGAAYFLQTEKGKQVRTQVSKSIDEASKSTQQFASETSVKLKSMVDDATIKGQEIVENAQTQFTSAKETISDKISSGSERAKSIIANKESQIKEQLNNV